MLHIAFDSPWFLLLLVALPWLWWISFRSLGGLGPVRRALAIALRTAVYVLLVLALSEMQWVRSTDRLTVIYLLDQSLSISQSQTDAMIKYINESIRKQRDAAREDRAGVIVFGTEAAVELPPLDETQQMPRVETMIDREHTNLAGAMKMAVACFPHDTEKRIVILTDGNQNVGDALAQARALADANIGIDVVPIRSQSFGEVSVEKVSIPADVRRGQPFDVSVVLNNKTAEGRESKSVEGRLQIVRKAGGREQMLTDQDVTVEPGVHAFRAREEIESPDFYTYEARFVPKNPADDTLPQNNQATTFTHVRGSGQVLVLEDFENKGEFKFFVERLRAMNIEVALRSTRPEELFNDLAELQPYDSIVLANVPREQFSDEQVEMLARNTQNMGGGLIMMGGPNSFGAGGWTNTPVEEVMPVEFQIKNAKVIPVGALAMLMHASEMADGNYWQKVIAREALKTLGDQDYCGVIHWGLREEWLWGGRQGMLKVGPNRGQMLGRLDRMTPGDMPEFESSLILARNEFANLPDAASKHMIIISDGDPADANYGPSGGIAGLIKQGVKISTVAIGAHGAAGHARLRAMALKTGGKYYVVTNARTLPRIYQKEARRISRSLVFERATGFRPQIKYPHEMVQGIENPLPPITGYVLTTAKDNPLVEISLVSPEPPGQTNNTILASWTYGLGKAVAFTTDAGHRWASDWVSWSEYDRLFSQIVRWSMRPSGDTGKFTVSTDVRDGKVRVVVTALDKDDEFLNFLNFSSIVVGPDMKPIDLGIKQTAPGRYIGEFDAKKTGSYLLMVSPGAGKAPIRAGLSIPYSDEFRERETNDALLTSLAHVAPKDGAAGQVIDAPANLTGDERLAHMLETNEFRRDLAPATSSQGVWHLLVLTASCLFFFDIFVRRVTVSFAWVGPLAVGVRDRLLGRDNAKDVEATIERLRSSKAEVAGQLEQKLAALRFEPAAETPGDATTLEETIAKTNEAAARQAAKPASLTPEQEQDSYTARLLKAKQKARGDQKKDQPDRPESTG